MVRQIVDDWPLSGWRLSLYPDAGEAGGCFYRPPSGRAPKGGDPERARAEATRRARSKVRRYCAANRLNRLGTLTYAGEGRHDQGVVRADLAEFFRVLRSATGGKALPYVWVPEWHKSGHGLHVQFAVGRYIGQRKIEQAWGQLSWRTSVGLLHGIRRDRSGSRVDWPKLAHLGR